MSTAEQIAGWCMLALGIVFWPLAATVGNWFEERASRRRIPQATARFK
jgi:hypothetical protein